MMKNLMVVALLFLTGSGVWSQEEEFITIFDFENAEPPQINATGWDHIFFFSSGDEPVHSGDYSLYIDIAGETSPWVFSTWYFPSDIGNNGTVDLSGTDQMEIWVYSVDAPFQMNWEFGGLNLGYRYYNEEDLGTWKRLAYWYTEENAAAFTAINSWGSFLNPDAINGFPAGFKGIIYMDDIKARIRENTPEREYLLLNGFNAEDDLANVTIPDAAVADGIVTDGAVAPTEGEGYLTVLLSDSGANRFILDVTEIAEVRQYDRIHFDLYMDGTAADGWGNFSFYVFATQIDENGEIVLNEDGDPVVNGTNILGGSYTSVATQQWHSFSAQYGPVENTDGFPFQDLKADVIDPAYATEGATVDFRLDSNGGGVNGVRLLIDNIRLSRAVGSPVNEWSLY